MPSVNEVRAALDAAYPPELAESWDTGIGLTCGNPTAQVERVLLAVDVDAITVAEAISAGAQLLLTHHPLLFRPVQSVAVDTDKGALIDQLIRAGVAHLACHTNADKAVGGVNDALAAALGLTGARPLAPEDEQRDKLVVFVPRAATEEVIAAVGAAGAGRIGQYSDAAFVGTGVGRFRPGPGAHPAIGTIGELALVDENRVEVVLPRSARMAVVAALRGAHPYEEPAFDLIELADLPGDVGLGRVGDLPAPMRLADFADYVVDRLPTTAAGVQAAGDPDRPIRTVAVCGGAGASLLGAASRSGADAFVTSDLSHHVVAEHIADPARPAVVRVAHWAGEWPWLDQAAAVLAPLGVTCTVSTRCTDPWSTSAGH